MLETETPLPAEVGDAHDNPPLPEQFGGIEVVVRAHFAAQNGGRPGEVTEALNELATL